MGCVAFGQRKNRPEKWLEQLEARSIGARAAAAEIIWQIGVP